MDGAVRICALTAALALAGCGGGDDGGDVGTSQVGTFIDAPVSGMEYETASGSGLTDADGHFTYRQGELVTFRVGKLVIGSTVPDATRIVTPKSLVEEAVSMGDPQVTLILQTLQSLDANGDPDDGIQISAEDREELEKKDYELNLEVAEEAEVETLLGYGLTVSPTEATQHFTKSLSSMGRLLASNCYQCHGTNGSGGFDRLNGESADSLYNELREFALKKDSDADNIMSAHAKGYTDAQMRAIAVYLANIR
jgi:cytochrome c553